MEYWTGGSERSLPPVFAFGAKNCARFSWIIKKRAMILGRGMDALEGMIPLQSMEKIQAPHLAATVILIDSQLTPTFRVLLIKRPMNLRVLPGFWVFPGGRVECVDHADSTSLSDAIVRAAIRETREEVGIQLEKKELIWFGRRVTPDGFKFRFDTHFFIAHKPLEATIQYACEEVEEVEWCSPLEAYQNAENGRWHIAPPTRDALRTLTSFTCMSDLFNGGVMQEQVQNRDEIMQFMKLLQTQRDI